MKTIYNVWIIAALGMIAATTLLVNFSTLIGAVLGLSLGILINRIPSGTSSRSYSSIGLDGDLDSLKSEWNRWLINEDETRGGRYLYRAYMSHENYMKFMKNYSGPVQIVPINGLPDNKFTLEYRDR